MTGDALEIAGDAAANALRASSSLDAPRKDSAGFTFRRCWSGQPAEGATCVRQVRPHLWVTRAVSARAGRLRCGENDSANELVRTE